MRILFVSREYPPDTGGGGIGSYVASVAPALAQLGHDIHVLSCAPGQEERDVWVADGVTVHRRAAVRLRGARRVLGKPAALRVEAALSVWRQHRRLGSFDVVEVPDWLGEGLLLSQFERTPTVSQLHTPHRLTQEYLGREWRRSDALADRLERAAVRSSTVTTAPSNLIVRALVERGWLDERPVEIIPLPIDWPYWAGVGDVRNTAPVTAVIGRVEPRKGQLQLVEALARAAIDNASLMLVGWAHDDAYRSEIEERAKRGGVDVQWIGQVPRSDLPELMARVRVVAVPSTFDSFSMAAMEGMAAGRPVVLSKMVGAAELLDGSAGAVAAPGDADAWAAALHPYLLDAQAASDAGRAARDLVRETADPTVIARRRVECYWRAQHTNLDRVR